MSGHLTHVPVAPLPPARFKEILTAGQAEELDRTIVRARKLLEGRVVWSVNSTARGGGVAEMLASLIAYSRGAGVDARWTVIAGDEDFFRTTKRLHNRLHGSPGDGGPLGPEEEAVYRRTTERNARELSAIIRPGDLVILHDPQTAGLVTPLRERGARVVWRCHVGVDLAGEEAREAWRFLLPFIRGAEAYVFSRKSFVSDDLDGLRTVVIPPSIDAFSPKNQALAPERVEAILRCAGIEAGSCAAIPSYVRQDGTPGRVDRRADLLGGTPVPERAPLLVQVSRWDRLKDHVGVLEAFCEEIGLRTDAHLMLAGPSAAAVADDPEAREVLEEVRARWGASPEPIRGRVHLASLPMEDVAENAAIVNALQRRASVIAQKSLAEGFGLTVAEGMWKGRPVVGSRVGGIQDQIVDGKTGLLVDAEDLAGFADAVAGLLSDPARAKDIGRRAREDVRDSFLGPRHLTQYVDLFEALLRGAPLPPGHP